MVKFIQISQNIYNKVSEIGNKVITSLGSDGLLHAYFSTILTIISLWLLGFFGLIIPVAVGILKEVMDLFVTANFSKKDLVADGIGILIGIVLSIL